jgi:two-component system OmpR family response regulator
MRILLIEDNRDIAVALREALKSSYTVVIASSGSEGFALVCQQDFDGIILDLNLPDTTGLQLCSDLRANGCHLPILVVSGDAAVMSKIRLLDAGADDYLTKPFSLGELKARLRVLLRVQPTLPRQNISLQVGNLLLDTNRCVVVRDGNTIQLRRKEFAILECLMRNAGQVVSRTSLGEYAWRDTDSPWANTIDVHIKYLRDKIDRPFEQQLIKTVHGFGYRLEAEAARITEKV